MKWVKVGCGSILGLLAVAVIVLLLLGRRESANRLHGSIEIDRPPRQVYTWITEKEKLPRWVGWLVEVRETGPQGVGGRRTWVMDDPNMKQRIEVNAEIATYDPPFRLGVNTSMPGGFDGTATYTLTDLGHGRTRLETDHQFRFDHWLANLLKPLVARQAQKKMRDDLARLKSQVEAEPPLVDHPESGT
jgi:uncharacterized protein YndB with AHSA1/START domain